MQRCFSNPDQSAADDWISLLGCVYIRYWAKLLDIAQNYFIILWTHFSISKLGINPTMGLVPLYSLLTMLSVEFRRTMMYHILCCFGKIEETDYSVMHKLERGFMLTPFSTNVTVKLYCQSSILQTGVAEDVLSFDDRYWMAYVAVHKVGIVKMQKNGKRKISVGKQNLFCVSLIPAGSSTWTTWKWLAIFVRVFTGVNLLWGGPELAQHRAP